MEDAIPSGEEYSPVEKEDEDEGEEEGGDGGEYLVGELLGDLGQDEGGGGGHHAVPLGDPLLPGGVLPAKQGRHGNHCKDRLTLTIHYYSLLISAQHNRSLLCFNVKLLPCVILSTMRMLNYLLLFALNQQKTVRLHAT